MKKSPESFDVVGIAGLKTNYPKIASEIMK